MNRKMLMAVVLGVGMIGGVPAFAQDAGGPPGGGPGGPGGGPGGGGRWNPEMMQQMRQRMMDRMKEQMGASDDEWKVLQPKIEKLQQVRMQSMAGMGGMMGGGRGRGGPGGGQGGGANMPANPVRDAGRDLQQLLDNKDATADQIKVKLQALRDAKNKAKEEMTAAQNDVKELLTVRQEAVLVENGLLD